MRLSVRRLALLSLFVAAPCAADQNIVQNGDFAGGVSGWTTSATGSGVSAYESFLGSPGGGSLRLQVYGIGTAHAEQCLDVSQFVTFDFALRKFKNAEGGSGTHQFKLDLLDGAACAGNVLDTIALPEAGADYAGWIRTSVFTTVLPVGTLSARLTLDTASADAGSVGYYLIDHVEAGTLGDVFKDSFESN